MKKNIFYLLFLVCNLFSCTKSLIPTKNPLAGIWNLHVIEKQDSLAIWRQSQWMKNGTGLLHYDNEQHVSVHFTPQNYGESDSLHAYWYVAEYEIIMDSAYVKHSRILHSDPKKVGESVKRYFEIKDDTLIMHAKEFGFRLKWTKM